MFEFVSLAFHSDIEVATMSSASDFQPHSGGEKDIQQKYINRKGKTSRDSTGDIPYLRARNNISNVRRTYGNAVGNLGARDDESTETAEASKDVFRNHIRRRLKEKEKIPGHVQWIKWMHSEWKNRT